MEPNEAARLAALRAHRVLDTPREASFDRLTALAARACDTPVGFVALVDEDRWWFESSFGMPDEQIGRATAFCAHTIEQRGAFAIHDTLADPRFVDNPYVTAEPHLRAYHGVPLVTSDGRNLGTLAVIDQVPRQLDALQIELLDVLAEQVVAQLEHRRQIADRDDLTVELDRVTSALGESAERYHQLFEANPQPMWIYDVETLEFLAVNDAAVHEYGYTRAEFASMTIADIRPPEDIGRLRLSVSSTGDGMASSGTWRHVRSDGGVVNVDIVSHPLRYEEREARMVHIRSVSEPELADRRAAERLEQLRAMFEPISDAVLAVDRDWRYTYVNAAAERLIRRPAADLVGRSIWDEAPRFVAMAGDDLRKVMDDGITRQFELDSEEGDRWAEVRVSAAPEGLWFYGRDITEQRLADERVRMNDERFRAVARATTDAIYDWDLTTGSAWWSDGLERLFGHDWSRADSSVWAETIHPDDRAQVTESLERYVRGSDDVWSGEYRFARLDGSYAVVLDRAHAVRGDDGRVLRLIGGMTDVTALREADSRLNQSQHLEAVGQLTGGVAHDFNNLLTVILGTSESLVAELAAAPDLQELADMARTAALRGAELSHRLLAFARRQPLEPRGTDTNELVGQLDGLLRRTLPADIDVEMVRGAGVWPTFIDPAQLEDALLNLCLNARDAMPTGGRLTIETANARIDQDYADQRGDVQPGQYVLVAVSDTGTGIAPADLERIFEPFFSTKPQGAGSGLGLSMVHGFVKQSAGHIAVYSEVGDGTTIRMYLPRAAAVEGMPREEEVSLDRLRGTETIVLVEDDDLVRRFAVDQLHALGYRVFEAANGHAALALLAEHRDDVALLFTDVVMAGGMSGRQLADRAVAAHPGLRVLYTSGYTENAIVHHGRLDPGVHLLAKPYPLVELARKVRAVLDAAD